MKKLLTILSLTFSIFLTAQTPHLKFGDISPYEWEMQYCEFDSTASAVILMEQCFIHFSGNKAYYRIHRRIKILDEKGFEKGNISIPYYHRDKREWVAGFKGVTYFMEENGKVNKVSAKEDFKEKVNEYWSLFKVPFPAIKKGAIIEYRYEFVTGNLFSLEPWEFQHDIPTVYSALSFELPSYLQYSIIGFGSRYQAKYDKVDRKKWVLEKLPGYKDEDFVYNPKDYIDQVRFQAFSQLTSHGWEEVVKDWNALGADLQRDYYSKVFKKAKRNKEILEGLFNKEVTDEEKVKKIFEFVKNTYNWNGYYSIYPGKAFDDLLKTKTGNIAGLNLWLTALLRQAGLEANPVLISTKSHGKPVRNFPLLDQFNNVICSVEVEGKRVLLDVVQREGILPYSLLPLEDLNYIGLLVKKESVEWISIPFSKESKSQTLVELNLKEGIGNMKLRFRGYPASQKRLALMQEESLFEKVLFENISGNEIHVDQTEASGVENPEDGLVVDYNINLGDPATEDVIYFNPGIWTSLQETPFKKDERSLPVELPYPYFDQIAIKVVLPDGYKLDEVPESISLTLPEGLGVFSYSVRDLESYFLISLRLKMSGVYMAPETYFYLKEFHERISQKVNEVLVFRKK